MTARLCVALEMAACVLSPCLPAPGFCPLSCSVPSALEGVLSKSSSELSTRLPYFMKLGLFLNLELYLTVEQAPRHPPVSKHHEAGLQLGSGVRTQP